MIALAADKPSRIGILRSIKTIWNFLLQHVRSLFSMNFSIAYWPLKAFSDTMPMLLRISSRLKMLNKLSSTTKTVASQLQFDPSM